MHGTTLILIECLLLPFYWIYKYIKTIPYKKVQSFQITAWRANAYHAPLEYQLGWLILLYKNFVQ
ncbi:hypothetical protein EA848_05855 [Vibrio anguillarum]|nr:hypothetical protein [Vibrio anguillarum]MBF4288263.1 hypothetical protein [Vibrio anguillarum]MBF4340316.1 hypothetical protein [Vibrio anguillarum]MBF4356257.1 hypothetical protein [Vibrio anguillarum]MBF4380454.1 hypothetical protein [Vibrio anguillarum]